MAKFPLRQDVSLNPIGMGAKNVLGSFVESVKPIVSATGEALDYLQEEKDKYLLNRYRNEMTRRLDKEYSDLKEQYKGIYADGILAKTSEAVDINHNALFQKDDSRDFVVPEHLRKDCEVIKDGLLTSYYSQGINYSASELKKANDIEYKTSVENTATKIANSTDVATIKTEQNSLYGIVYERNKHYGDNVASDMAKQANAEAAFNNIATMAQRDAYTAIAFWQQHESNLYKDLSADQKTAAIQLLRKSVETEIAEEIALNKAGLSDRVVSVDFLASTGLYDEEYLFFDKNKGRYTSETLEEAQRNVLDKAEKKAVSIRSLNQQKKKEENTRFIGGINNLTREQLNEILASGQLNGVPVSPEQKAMVNTLADIDDSIMYEQSRIIKAKQGYDVNNKPISKERQEKILKEYNSKRQIGLAVLSQVNAGNFGDPLDVMRSEEFRSTTYEVKQQIIDAMYNASKINTGLKAAGIDIDKLSDTATKDVAGLSTTVAVNREEIKANIYKYLSQGKNLEYFIKTPEQDRQRAVVNIISRVLPSLYEDSPETKEVASLYETAYYGWNNLSKTEKGKTNFMTYLQSALEDEYSDETVENILNDVYTKNFYTAGSFILERGKKDWF